MKPVFCILALLGYFLICPAQEPPVMGPRIIPLVFDPALAEQWPLNPGEQVWVELEYTAIPDGDIIHEEMGEQLWWIQDEPILFLGASGLRLPNTLKQRATAFVHVFFDGAELVGSPFPIAPQRDTILVRPEKEAVAGALKKRLAGIDASYLAQVTNFLANHLTQLDVQGSSYWVSGYGQVIDATGAWVGPGISGWEEIGGTTLDYAGDTRIGGGATAYDYASEYLAIRAQADDWYLAVSNDATAGDTDCFIGTSSNKTDSKILIENDGDVGIGTYLPQSKLDVAGRITSDGLDSNGTITATSSMEAPTFESQDTRTRYVAIMPFDFVPSDNTLYSSLTRTSSRAYLSESYSAIMAPVHLPHNATITGFSAYVTDSAFDRLIFVELRRRLGAPGVSFVIARAESSASGTGQEVQNAPSIDHAVVSNASYVYYVFCALENAAGLASEWTNGQHQLHNARIEYTLDSTD